MNKVKENIRKQQDAKVWYKIVKFRLIKLQTFNKWKWLSIESKLIDNFSDINKASS